MNETARAYGERVVEMSGAQGPLVGVLCEPPADARAAVLIVAGQPQTRVGSHRMFTDLARMLAARGVVSLRFDVGGWGDSPGEALPFERSDRDIAVAAARLRSDAHTGAPLAVLGLCDGASAAVLALPALRESAVVPDVLVLLNPWVRSEASLADAMVRTYYAKRLLQREFWARLLTGKVSLTNLLSEPLRHLLARFRTRRTPSTTDASGRGAGSGTTTPGSGAHTAEAGAAMPRSGELESVSTTIDGESRHIDAGSGTIAPESTAIAADLPAQLLAQLERYRGRVLTVLSGDDLTAGETESLIARDRRWHRRLERDGEVLRMAGADHTFSRPAQWAQVADWIAERASAR